MWTHYEVIWTPQTNGHAINWMHVALLLNLKALKKTKNISPAPNIIPYIVPLGYLSTCTIHHLLLWCDGSVFLPAWQQLDGLTSSDSFRSIVWLDAAPGGPGRGRRSHQKSFLVVSLCALISSHLPSCMTGNSVSLSLALLLLNTAKKHFSARENSSKAAHLYGFIT